MNPHSVAAAHSSNPDPTTLAALHEQITALRSQISALQTQNEALQRQIAGAAEPLEEAPAAAPVNPHHDVLLPGQQLQSIAENLHEGLLLTDLDDVVFYANSHMAQMSGYEVEEMIGRPAYQLLLPREQWPVVQNQNKNRARGESGQYELLMQRKDGSALWCLVNASPLRNAGGEIVGTLGAQSDITARKEAELRQVQLRAQLERSNAELQGFAYAASHDLKEPLRKIEVFGSRLESRLAERLDDEDRDYLRRMRAAARRMAGLINGLLAFSRVTTAAAEPERVDLTQVAHEVLQDFEIEIGQAQAQVEVENLPVVRADARQMRQLLQHLISNALQFRREETQLRLRLAGQSDAARWVFSIEDNGRGFDNAQSRHIFEVFARLENRAPEHTLERGSEAAGEGGFGVGLTICRKIVERHGGSIEARGEVGQGATFVIVLPRQKPN
ncbi:MAG TPA: ATP-binding protein [Abditibacterium sp.]